MRHSNKYLLMLGIFLAATIVSALFLHGKHQDILQQTESAQAEAAAVETFAKTAPTAGFTNQVAVDALKKRAAHPAQRKNTHAQYLSPEGISFVSYSTKWDEALLEELYGELLQNKHGEELLTLSEVVVYPQEDEAAAATHQKTYQELTLRLSFPTLPDTFEIPFRRSTGVITLYNGDKRTTPALMANTLSHEYGHHYTFHHFFPTEITALEFLNSQYAKLRGIDSADLEFDRTNPAHYLELHHWYLIEIAAEDYVTLMGSPNSRHAEDYLDVRDSLNGETGERPTARNAFVQENLMIPLASEKAGLAAYFYSFTDTPLPTFPEKKAFHLTVSPYSESFDLTTGTRTFTGYEFTWDKVYGDDAIYTLVSYDEKNYSNRRPVKTVFAGEAARANVGEAWYSYDGGVSYANDHLARGTHSFLVTAILPNGTLACSDPLSYTF